MIYINMWAVLVAAIAATAVGALWYSPILFGKPWMRMSGITPESMGTVSRSAMIWSYVASFIATLVSVFVLSKMISWVSSGNAVSSMKLVALIWFGFVAAFGLNSVLWEKKPWGVYFINIGHYLVALVVAALIIVAWK